MSASFLLSSPDSPSFTFFQLPDFRMPHAASQAFLWELDKKLWIAADRLRSNLDAAVYKHAVLGLFFLKYVSESFAQRQAEIEGMLKDPEHGFFIDRADHKKPGAYEEAISAELEERDYYIEKNVFWVPALARWKTLQDSAKLPAGTEITVKNGKTTNYKITSTGKLIDDALEAVEKENPKLKNVLNKNYTQLQIDPANLAGLINLMATIPFQHADLPRRTSSATFSFLGQWSGATWTARNAARRVPPGGGINSPWRRGKRAGNTSQPTRSSASSWK